MLTISHRLIAFTVVVTASIGCSGDVSDATVRGEFTFKVNGSPIQYDDSAYPLASFNCCVYGSSFRLSAFDRTATGFGTLEIYGTQWGRGPQTFVFEAGDSLNFASFRPDGHFSRLGKGTTFSTGRGGSGSLTVESVSSCTTKSGEDPFTGVSGSRTYCDIEGTFQFSAENESGDVVDIADGRFRIRDKV